MLHGPFDEEAARAIAGGETFDAATSFDILTQLVEKSLVQVDLESGQYRLLATISDYVRNRLVEFDDPQKISTAASKHYAGVVHTLRIELENGAPPSIFERYAAARENVETILESALTGDDVETGAALAAGMGVYWIEAGLHRDAQRFLNTAIERAEDLSRRRLLDVLEAAIEVEAAGNDVERLESLTERFRAETGSSNDGAETARVMLALALAHHGRARFDEAGSLYHHASNAFRIANQWRSLARSLIGWSEIVAEHQGDLSRAIALLTEALEAARGSGSPSLTLDVVASLVDLQLQRGDEGHAIEIIHDIAAHCHEFEDEPSSAFTTLMLARVELRSDPIVGRMHARDALEGLREFAHPGRIAACFELFARIAVDGQQDETASRLMAFAANLRRTHGIAGSSRERREIARISDILERRMDRLVRDRTSREGRAMALDLAVHRALTEGKSATPESAQALILA
jgi:tetratricopeptide (TPR) repeat protein